MSRTFRHQVSTSLWSQEIDGVRIVTWVIGKGYRFAGKLDWHITLKEDHEAPLVAHQSILNSFNGRCCNRN